MCLADARPFTFVWFTILSGIGHWGQITVQWISHLKSLTNKSLIVLKCYKFDAHHGTCEHFALHWVRSPATRSFHCVTSVLLLGASPKKGRYYNGWMVSRKFWIYVHLTLPSDEYVWQLIFVLNFSWNIRSWPQLSALTIIIWWQMTTSESE